MVKGAVEEHISQQGEAALLQGVVVEVQGEVEQDRGPVKQQQLFDKGDQGGPPLPEQTGHQEPAGHREEKGDGDAGQNVGQKVVGLPVQGEQRAGMDGDDQQGGGDAEAVKAARATRFSSRIPPQGEHHAALVGVAALAGDVGGQGEGVRRPGGQVVKLKQTP